MPSVNPTVTRESVVRALMGDLVDVSKMGPDPSSVHVNGLIGVRRKKGVAKLDDKGKRQVTAGLSATGAVAGAAGLAYAGHDISTGRRAARAAGRVYKVPLKTKALIPLEIAGLGGEVAATRILHGDTKMVHKSVPHPNMVAGRLQSSLKALRLSRPARTTESTRGLYVNKTPTPPTPGVPRGAVPSNATGPLTERQVKSMESAAKLRTKAEDFVGSTAGKVTGGVVAAAAVHRSGRKKGYQDAYYGKNDVEIAGTFSKFDDDKKRAYGWASVVTMDGEPVVDRQGDYIGLEDIEEAAYTYVRKSRVTGDMHRRTDDDTPHKAGELIESVVFTPDKCHAMGLPASFAGKWWMGVQVEDDEVWAEVKKGNRTGFSIHGKGLRKDTTLDDIKAGR